MFTDNLISLYLSKRQFNNCGAFMQDINYMPKNFATLVRSELPQSFNKFYIIT